MCLYVAAGAHEFPVSFTIVVIAASLSFIAVICLLIVTSSSYRRCCRPTMTSARRTVGRPSLQSVSAGVLEPRLVSFTTNHSTGHHDRVNKTFRYTDDGGIQSVTDDKYQRRRQTEHAEPTTSSRVNPRHKLERRDDDVRSSAVSGCLDMRSFSAPVIVNSRTDPDVTDHRRQAVADRTTSAVSTRVDSGVSGMQSSVGTLTSSATEQEPPPDLGVVGGECSRGQSAICAVDSPPTWNLSQMSMDVRSCPGGTVGTSGISMLPPLYLYQYVNGYSDAMLMHVVDRHQRSSLHDSCISHTASTTATHCAADADPRESHSHCCSGDVETSAPRGALTVQTEAIVEPRRTSSSHDIGDSPCVCGQSHQLPSSPDSDLPPPPICAQTDLSPSMTSARELSLQPHPPPPPINICRQTLELPLSPSNCDRQLNVIKATVPSEVERRCLLTRILLGHGDQLTLSPVLIDETYF